MRRRLRLVLVVLLGGTMWQVGCTPLLDEGAMQPDASEPLLVSGSTITPEITIGEGVLLRATASGGSEPYVFRWEQNGGPEEGLLGHVTGAAVSTAIFNTPGRYVFRVRGTDAAGRTGVDFVEVNAAPAVTVAAAVDDAGVFEGATVALSAQAESVHEPVSFEWEYRSGPIEMDLSDRTESAITTDALTAAGTYRFHVTATDSEGFTAMDTVEVVATSAVEIVVPEMVVVGEAVTLEADILTDAQNLTVLWEVVEGSGTFVDDSLLSPELTSLAAESLTVMLTLFVPVEGSEPAAITREATLVSIEDRTPRVVIETSFGDITLELDADAAPGHTAHFLRYVDEGFYDGVLFHRVACRDDDATVCEPFVLQGGGYERVDDELEEKEPTQGTVESEAGNGLSNGAQYSIAMALLGSDPDSGNTQFFINLGDNAFLDERDFTVFGIVAEGRDVVDDIADTERMDSDVLPGEISQPVNDVVMERVRRQ